MPFRFAHAFTKHFGWLIKFVPLGVGVMFGVLGGIREVVNTFSSHPDPSAQRKLFWACVWIASFIALVIAWIQKNRELIAERSRNAKPQIQGDIREVFFVKEVDLDYCGGNAPDEYELFYGYRFIVRVYIANMGTATTLERFTFALNFGGKSYEGKKLAIRNPELQVKRSWGKWNDSVIDIEDENDRPLEHTRNGWLRFIVRGVFAGKGDNMIASDSVIEIVAVDKYGNPHPIRSLPQADWRENLESASECVKQYAY